MRVKNHVIFNLLPFIDDVSFFLCLKPKSSRTSASVSSVLKHSEVGKHLVKLSGIIKLTNDGHYNDMLHTFIRIHPSIYTH